MILTKRSRVYISRKVILSSHFKWKLSSLQTSISNVNEVSPLWLNKLHSFAKIIVLPKVRLVALRDL